MVEMMVEVVPWKLVGFQAVNWMRDDRHCLSAGWWVLPDWRGLCWVDNGLLEVERRFEDGN